MLYSVVARRDIWVNGDDDGEGDGRNDRITPVTIVMA